MSTRHLSDRERTSLASELMSYRIKFYFLSKAQIVLSLEGIDVEVLRNLLHCTTTYLPFGQRQQSSQVSIGNVKYIANKWYEMSVTYSPVGSVPLIPLQIAKSSVIDCLDEGEPIINTELGLSLASTFSATRFEFQTIVEEDNSNVAMITFWAPRDLNIPIPCNHSFTDKDGIKFSFTVEHCGCILPQTGAPGEPPRHETKSEHWRKVGEQLNLSFKNRLTVIAPASAQNSSQRRRFGLLKESHVDLIDQPVSYTYAEENYPWILFLNSLPELDYLDVFLTRFSRCEAVKVDNGTYRPRLSRSPESLTKHARIILLQLPSGKQCQINRVEGTEEAPYLTKVDALHIYPFKDCYLMLFVPPLIDHSTLLMSATRPLVVKVWCFEPTNDAKGNSTVDKHVASVTSCATLAKKPTATGKTQQMQEKKTNQNQAPTDAGKTSLHPPPYVPADTVSPPSPLPQDIQPGQNNPYLSPESTKSLCRDIPSCNEKPLPSQTGGCVTAQATKEAHNHPPLNRAPQTLIILSVPQ